MQVHPKHETGSPPRWFGLADESAVGVLSVLHALGDPSSWLSIDGVAFGWRVRSPIEFSVRRVQSCASGQFAAMKTRALDVRALARFLPAKLRRLDRRTAADRQTKQGAPRISVADPKLPA